MQLLLLIAALLSLRASALNPLKFLASKLNMPEGTIVAGTAIAAGAAIFAYAKQPLFDTADWIPMDYIKGHKTISGIVVKVTDGSPIHPFCGLVVKYIIYHANCQVIHTEFDTRRHFSQAKSTRVFCPNTQLVFELQQLTLQKLQNLGKMVKSMEKSQSHLRWANSSTRKSMLNVFPKINMDASWGR